MPIRIDRKKLKTQMITQDMSVGELAKSAKISVSTLSNIRSGKSCTLKIAEAIAKTLNTSVERLS